MEPCKFEGEIKVLIEKVSAVKDDTAHIKKIIDGNGEPGLKTQTALNKQSLKRLWGVVGALLTGLIGFAFWIFRGGTP